MPGILTLDSDARPYAPGDRVIRPEAYTVRENKRGWRVGDTLVAIHNRAKEYERIIERRTRLVQMRKAELTVTA